MDRIRHMKETTYGQLAAADRVWYTGALIRVQTALPPSRGRGHIRYFDGIVLRSGGSYQEGDYTVFSGLEYGPVLVEIEHTEPRAECPACNCQAAAQHPPADGAK